MKTNPVMFIVIAVVVAGGSFFGGMKYQQSKTPTGGRQFQGTRQGENQGRFGASGGPVVGEIINKDDTSITVKLADGSSKIVLLPNSVSISKTDAGSTADIKTGQRVGVFGKNNSDGSMTAQNIQLNPMFRGMGETQASPSSK